MEKTPSKVKSYERIAILTVLLVVAFAVGSYLLKRQVITHSNNQTTEQYEKITESSSDNTRKIMDVTSRGGMCPNGECNHKIYSIYSNGVYTGHSRLAPNQVHYLESLLDELKDDPRTKQNNAPCQSYLDGTDPVWITPDFTAVPCEIKTPKNTQLIREIEQIIY